MCPILANPTRSNNPIRLSISVSKEESLTHTESPSSSDNVSTTETYHQSVLDDSVLLICNVDGTFKDSPDSKEIEPPPLDPKALQN